MKPTTTMKFHKGDRVRLNQWAWQTYFHSRDREREGAVLYEPRTERSVTVVWDGRQSPDNSLSADHLEHSPPVTAGPPP